MFEEKREKKEVICPPIRGPYTSDVLPISPILVYKKFVSTTCCLEKTMAGLAKIYISYETYPCGGVTCCVINKCVQMRLLYMPLF